MSVTYLEQSQSLPAKVFEFLKLLVTHAQHTVSKEQAIECVWDNNTEVGKRGVGNAIWQLRKTWTELGLDPDDYFKTVPKVGYQLILPVAEVKGNFNPLTAHSSYSATLKATLISAIIILIGLFSFWHFNQKDATNTNIKAKKITHFEGVEEQAAISPDGKRMAFLWQRDRKQSQIYIKDLIDAHAPLRQVSMSSFSELSPTWSPDSQSLAYLQIQDNDVCSVRIRDLISNQDTQIDTGCSKFGYRRNLSWSPDGNKLAYVKSVDAQKAIFIYDFSSKLVKQISSPNSEIHDVLIQWSSNSEQLLYVREHEMSAELVLHDLANSTEQALPYVRDMIIGLAWQFQSNQLFITALKEGNFVIETLNLDDFEVSEFHKDTTISSLTVNAQGSKLYYSNHIGQEYITRRDMVSGEIQSQVISSARDLFGQYIAATNEILYVSNRNGNWELWSKKDGLNTKITDEIGVVSLPSVSAQGLFAVLIKPKGQINYQLYFGDRNKNTLELLPEFVGKHIKYPSFTSDGSSITYSRQVGDKWEIQQYNLEDKSVTSLHQANARYTVKSDNGLYFTKENQSGLFYLDLISHKETKLISDLDKSDWGNFFVEQNTVYFVTRTREQDIVKQRDRNGRLKTLFSLPAKSIRTGRALAKGKQGQVIVSMLGINDADIYEVDLTAHLKP
ncbi:winged helix-turn-helix domain-containing protein [Parashewanella tropica]|uniref:winged helix-turn-helix domain-containing protein n=1 Tax=Parashewanella tropica TaxID=2547970 RepID=UPI00147873A0|nr:winged helix-turn-helix domain-containing protein [Parashewanella tropica]